MSMTVFDIAANENFESLRKANEKIKKEKYFLDSIRKKELLLLLMKKNLVY